MFNLFNFDQLFQIVYPNFYIPTSGRNIYVLYRFCDFTVIDKLNLRSGFSIPSNAKESSSGKWKTLILNQPPRSFHPPN